MVVQRQLGEADTTALTGRARCGDANVLGTEDDRLVARTLAGDRAAYAGIVERHREPVRRLAFRLLGDADDADDAAQEAFVRAYVNLTRYRAGSSMRAWLLAIVRNWCLDQLRRRQTDRRRMVRLEMVMEWLESCDAAPESRLLQTEMYTDLRHRVAAMPKPYQLILALRYEHDLSYAEIGHVLSSPVSTVRMRLFRAHRHLAGGAVRDAGYARAESPAADWTGRAG